MPYAYRLLPYMYIFHVSMLFYFIWLRIYLFHHLCTYLAKCTLSVVCEVCINIVIIIKYSLYSVNSKTSPKCGSQEPNRGDLYMLPIQISEQIWVFGTSQMLSNEQLDIAIAIHKHVFQVHDMYFQHIYIQAQICLTVYK